MTNPAPDRNCNEDFAELVENLNELRDSWIEVALALHDFQFAKDLKARANVTQQSNRLLGNVMQTGTLKGPLK